MKNKKCPICLEVRDENFFCKDKRRRDGLCTLCKSCYSKKYPYTPKDYKRKYTETLDSCLKKIWFRMVSRCKHKPEMVKRNIKVLFSKDEFISFVKNKTNYEDIYNNWVKNNYYIRFAPTIDRIDNSGNYEFSNIQILTQSENSKKGGGEKL